MLSSVLSNNGIMQYCLSKADMNIIRSQEEFHLQETAVREASLWACNDRQDITERGAW